MSWIFWAALGHTTLYCLYDYFGYYNVCYLAEEIRDPGRVIPRAILFSIVAVAVALRADDRGFISVVPVGEAGCNQVRGLPTTWRFCLAPPPAR